MKLIKSSVEGYTFYFSSEGHLAAAEMSLSNRRGSGWWYIASTYAFITIDPNGSIIKNRYFQNTEKMIDKMVEIGGFDESPIRKGRDHVQEG